MNHLYQNTGGGTFSKVTDAGPITSDSADSRSAAWGDYDGDGDLDLFVANNYGISRTQQHHAHAHEHANTPHSLCCHCEVVTCSIETNHHLKKHSSINLL